MLITLEITKLLGSCQHSAFAPLLKNFPQGTPAHVNVSSEQSVSPHVWITLLSQYTQPVPSRINKCIFQNVHGQGIELTFDSGFRKIPQY